MEKATADAKEKAAVLAHAAGVALRDILTIDYSFAKIDFEVRPAGELMMEKLTASPADGYDVDIEPDDIEASDTVTFVWEID